MFTKETIAEIAAIAHHYRYDPASLLAVADVESAGIAYAIIDGHREPLIRFEGHYFDARLSGSAKAVARQQGLAHHRAGVIANPLTQAGRWRMLERAAAIDRKAAYESTSWGLGQVMGTHWELLDFNSVDELVRQARSSVRGQAQIMAGYIAATGLERALSGRDWRGFARGYNGPGYEKHGYHTKMQAAYKRYSSVIGSAPSREILRLGSSGREVEKLQSALNAHGHDLIIDGLFGRVTRNALKKFQKDNGLIVDGVAGPAVLRALHFTSQESRSRLIPSLNTLLWRRG